MLFLHGDFLHHRLRGSELIFSAERHKHGTRAYRGIKPFRQPALGAYIEIADKRPEIFTESAAYALLFQHSRRRLYGNVLRRAVGIEEIAADINDFFAPPSHDKTVFIRHNSDESG